MGEIQKMQTVKMIKKSDVQPKFHVNELTDESNLTKPPYDNCLYCKSCCKIFSEEISMIQHRSICEVTKADFPFQSNPNIICDFCKEEFSTKESFDTHIKLVHLKDEKFECKKCHIKFTRKCDLFRHERRHNGEKTHVCSECNRKFSEKGDLNSHFTTHMSVDPYNCHLCDKTFGTIMLLRTHVNNHVSVKLFPCELCDLKFRTKAHRFMHMKQFHKVSKLQSLETSYDSNSTGPTKIYQLPCEENQGINVEMANGFDPIVKIEDEDEEIFILPDDIFKCKNCSETFFDSQLYEEHSSTQSCFKIVKNI